MTLAQVDLHKWFVITNQDLACHWVKVMPSGKISLSSLAILYLRLHERQSYHHDLSSKLPKAMFDRLQSDVGRQFGEMDARLSKVCACIDLKTSDKTTSTSSIFMQHCLLNS